MDTFLLSVRDFSDGFFESKLRAAKKEPLPYNTPACLNPWTWTLKLKINSLAMIFLFQFRFEVCIFGRSNKRSWLRFQLSTLSMYEQSIPIQQSYRNQSHPSKHNQIRSVKPGHLPWSSSLKQKAKSFRNNEHSLQRSRRSLNFSAFKSRWSSKGHVSLEGSWESHEDPKYSMYGLFTILYLYIWVI